MPRAGLSNDPLISDACFEQANWRDENIHCAGCGDELPIKARYATGYNHYCTICREKGENR